MRVNVFVLFAIASNAIHALHAQESIDRQALIREIQTFQSSAAGNTIKAECSFEIRCQDGLGHVASRRPARFQFDDSRWFVSQYLAGDHRFGHEELRFEAGSDGKSSVTVYWEKESPLSATRNTRKPATLDLLDPNLCGGTGIAYGRFPPAEKWLKHEPSESFLVAFVREADRIEQSTTNALVVTKRVGTRVYSLTLTRKPVLHCVEYRAEKSATSNTTFEVIRMEYLSDTGFPRLIRTLRSVSLQSSTAPQEAEAIELVTAIVELKSLEFIDHVEDEKFLPTIPAGVSVRELRP